jgi:hypothetical protein
MKKEFLNRGLLLTFSLILSFGMAEGILRLSTKNSQMSVGTANTPKAEFYGWVFPPNYVAFQVDSDTGKSHEARTNSQGWRDIEHSLEKPKGVLRILILGDSNTFGAVPFEDLYTRRLEKILHERGHKNVEVISIASGGWGTDIQLEALKREGILYKPDVVIYQFCTNDVTDNVFQYLGTKPFTYKLENGSLVKTKNPKVPPTLSESMKNFAKKSVLLGSLSELRRRWIVESKIIPKTSHIESPMSPHHHLFLYSKEEQPAELAEAWRLLGGLVSEMKNVSERNGAKFLIFSEAGEEGLNRYLAKLYGAKLTASGAEYPFDGKTYSIDFERPLKELRRIASVEGIPLIPHKRPYHRFQFDIHPNSEGNLNMALDIADSLPKVAMSHVPSAIDR